jgi:hypothetical protein
MSELINMHKRIAMGGEQEANHLKKGGKVAKFAKGGQVEKLDTMPYKIMPKGKRRPESHQEDAELIGAYPEKGIANLPAKGSKPKLTKPEPHAVATMKKGGKMSAPKKGLVIAIAVGTKAKRGAKNY